MKKLILTTICFLLLISFSNSQEVIFPNSVITAGGELIKSDYIQISKWRIGSVNVLYYDLELIKNKSGTNNNIIKTSQPFSIQAYPNPVSDILNLYFDTEDNDRFNLEIIGLKGEKLFQKRKFPIGPKEIVQLDLTSFKPSLYIIHVTSQDSSISKILKVVKH